MRIIVSPICTQHFKQENCFLVNSLWCQMKPYPWDLIVHERKNPLAVYAMKELT